MIDFVFIGPSKSGSTWFFANLREHPEVFIPGAKDLYFFDRYFDRGLGWYRSFFTEVRGGQVAGEICHDYMSSPVAINRIADLFPEAKLICCLRNPVQRAFSAYAYFLRNGYRFTSIDEAVAAHPSIYEQGLYAHHLSTVFARFPRSQVGIWRFEDIQERPAQLLSACFAFLGVSQDFRSPLARKVINPASAPRSATVARIVKAGATVARRLGFPNVVGAIKRHERLSRILYRPQGRADEAKLPEWMLRGYEEDLRCLERLLGESFEGWTRRVHQQRSKQRGDRAGPPVEAG